MAKIGSITGFDEEVEDFDTYCARVEFYFIANNIKAAQKKAVFITLLGSKVFSLLQDLVSPNNLTDVDYDDVVKTLHDHYKPKVVIIYERYKFHTRSQGQNESVADFVAGLKSCARTCNFGDALDDMLRDRFVVGLLDDATQRVLLAVTDLTFQKAVSTALARESAARDVREMGRRLPIMSIKPQTNSKVKPQSSTNLPTTPCSGCGSMHWRRDCPWKDKECFRCRKKGHLKKFCKNAPSSPNKSNNANKSKRYSHATSRVSTASYDSPRADSEVVSEYDTCIFNTKVVNSTSAPITKEVFLNGVPLTMELDTGAARSLISSDIYQTLFRDQKPQLYATDVRLHAYGGVPLNVLGEIRVKLSMSMDSSGNDSRIVVVDGSGPALMGRDLFPVLGVSALSINKSFVGHSWNELFPKLFSPGLGCLNDTEVALTVDQSVTPKFCNARTIPYTLRDKVDEELKRLEEENIISPVSYSKWAAAIVPVVKTNGSIRICGDYKLTANRAITLDTYPIPRLEDMLSSLTGARVFSKLDMSQAYAQLKLDESSKPYTTINTPRGLFQYNRLPFGVSSAPGIFQRTMEGLLSDLPGVLCYLDDILMWGSSEKEHNDRVEAVLSRLQEKGLKLQASKCSFLVKEIKYLGYIISDKGIQTDPTKVSAIVDAPSPTNVKQLQAFLGSIGFYRRFLPKFSTIVEPLNLLLRDANEWIWGPKQEQAFAKAKQLLLDSEALVLFNPKLPLVVIADSSAYGIGAALYHKEGKTELPICFSSRSLTKAERNYSQLEKEALAMVFAMKKFHNYLWGQQFTVITDHKPLLGIFSPDKAIPPMASGRLQRWALILQSYRFKLIHRSGAVLGTADALSRLPLPTVGDAVPILGEWQNLINFLDHSPVTAATVANQTRTDPNLSKVLRYTELGWPKTVSDPLLSPFFARRDELSIEGGCVLWGYRVVIPTSLYTALLEEIHSSHTGSSRMKELARSYFWWPGLDKDLEGLVRSCPKCLEHRAMPPKAEIHPWDWPKHPWHRLHLDYAGPIKSKFYLILVDAHSKWVEIFPTTGPSASETIRCLRRCFAQFGLPVSIVSDNGTCFTSEEFQSFLERNGIQHTTSAVYKPSTNGLAERMVRTFKETLATTEDKMDTFLDTFLFKYRMTPHATTGVSPAELLLKRRMRCRLDLLFPSEHLEGRVIRKQQKQKESRSSRRCVNLSPGDSINVRNYASGPTWLPAEVTRQTGPVSYECRVPGGLTLKRHQDQIHPTDMGFQDKFGMKPLVTVDKNESLIPDTQPVPPTIHPSTAGSAKPLVQVDQMRRSTRIRRPVERLDL